MIFFCSEIWRYKYKGLITGIGDPSSVELYRILGNKRIRVGRICQWEKEHQRTYPRLRFHVTTKFHALDKTKWVKAETNDHLIPYRCT